MFHDVPEELSGRVESEVLQAEPRHGLVFCEDIELTPAPGTADECLHRLDQAQLPEDSRVQLPDDRAHLLRGLGEGEVSAP
ncbi:hypothetical protein ACGFS9_22875 [Streptomyces sp. NPDC048566]|uniref:hypothetical protein n=1 Tax=Streptomyces sp. NPDC048566 TaxID=3365569 RepID=UPI003715AC03